MGTYQTLKEEICLAKLFNGDQKTFDAFFQKYYPMLCAYGNRFVELEDAEEIAQDTMLWLWNNREELIIESSLTAYLLKMVYRRALNKKESNDAMQRAYLRFHENLQDLLQDTDLYYTIELNEQIQIAIAALPESYRKAFIMHRFQGKSYKEIAEILNISPKTVDYRIQQSLKLLRKDLKDYLPLLIFLLLPFRINA